MPLGRITGLYTRLARPSLVQLHQPRNYILLDLFPVRAVVVRDAEPLFAVLLDKNDLVLARVEQVADHDLVAVALERCACFRNEDRGVRFELRVSRT